MMVYERIFCSARALIPAISDVSGVLIESQQLL